ncbi:MAG: Rpn family recombination-promoting nuclease/putative transposase [Duncaniella sp.]|nr:Rpn family recombination-promoting nuclease/putative transposase [Duncaniella sp.]
MSRFINPFTDVGFKRIFGQSVNKEILISFLNALLEGERHITDLEFLDKERVPEIASHRGLIYDIYCSTDKGEHIIVEMQNRQQVNFSDRALLYAAADIAWQAQRGGNWDYKLTPVYGIYFMNFRFKESEDGGRNLLNTSDFDKLRTDVGLSDMETGKLFSDKLRMIFLQLPKIDLREEDCDTDFKKWLYVLKNMQTFDRMPFAAQKAVFDRLGSIAEIAAMPEKERHAYEESLRIYRDNLAIAKHEYRTGLAEGEARGEARGRKETEAEIFAENVMRMRSLGYDDRTISVCLNQPLDRVVSIR